MPGAASISAPRAALGSSEEGGLLTYSQVSFFSSYRCRLCWAMLSELSAVGGDNKFEARAKVHCGVLKSDAHSLLKFG